MNSVMGYLIVNFGKCLSFLLPGHTTINHKRFKSVGTVYFNNLLYRYIINGLRNYCQFNYYF